MIANNYYGLPVHGQPAQYTAAATAYPAAPAFVGQTTNTSYARVPSAQVMMIMILMMMIMIIMMIQVLRVHDGPVTGLSLHATGDYVLTTSTDQHWTFSDINTGQLVSRVTDTNNPVALTCAQVDNKSDLFLSQMIDHLTYLKLPRILWNLIYELKVDF